ESEAQRVLKALRTSAPTRRHASGNGAHRRRVSLIEASRAPLAHLLREADAAAAGDLTNSESLHSLRTASKRLRYGLEVFAGCFPAELRIEVYPGLVQIQDRLGAITDLQCLIDRLARELRQLNDDPEHEASGALSELLDRYRSIHDA